VWINAKVAAYLAIADGSVVRLVNQDGARSELVAVKATERIRGECVYLVHGWGHTARGLRYARGRGADDSGLVTRARRPRDGGTGMRGNFVAIQQEA
jgi:thiosulfate reductase/polysulfide reductase chain A